MADNSVPLPDQKGIDRIVRSAAEKLANEHRALFDSDLHETTIAHHLARYIRELVSPCFDVDMDYNRHGANPKRVAPLSTSAQDEGAKSKCVRPGIIVHRRGTDDCNVLVLELKKAGRDLARDRRKLRAFRQQLDYRHAAHVILGRTPAGDIELKLRWVDG